MIVPTIIGKILTKTPGPDAGWSKTIDAACALLAITERHIEIDSCRAVVRCTYTQLGQKHALEISFNDIVAIVNGSAARPANPPDSHVSATISPPGG